MRRAPFTRTWITPASRSTRWWWEKADRVGLLSHGRLALRALAMDRVSPRGQPKAVLSVEREQVPVEEGVDLRERGAVPESP